MADLQETLRQAEQAVQAVEVYIYICLISVYMLYVSLWLCVREREMS